MFAAGDLSAHTKKKDLWSLELKKHSGRSPNFFVKILALTVTVKTKPDANPCKQIPDAM